MSPKKCPLCGRGLSAKYQSAPHTRFLKRRLRRWSRSSTRNARCPWNGFA